MVKLPVHQEISLDRTCIEIVQDISCHKENEQRDRQC